MPHTGLADFARKPEALRTTLVSFVSSLYDQGCCVRCCTRFLGLHCIQLFNSSEPELVSFYNSLPEAKTQKKTLSPYPKESVPCKLCFGILQNGTGNKAKFSTELIEALALSGHEYKDFQFCVTVPPACFVIDLAIMKQLQDEATTKNAGTIDIKSFPSVKEVFKWVTSLAMPVRFKVESIFTISVNFENKESDSILEFFSKERDPRSRKDRYSKAKKTTSFSFTTPSLRKQLANKSIAQLKEIGILPLPVIQKMCTLHISFEHGYVYVAGRYNKYSRNLSQTPWLIDGVRKGENSVEELLAWRVVELYEASGFSFSSAGREDIDVCMLGNGRPFLLEIHNPKKPYITNEQLAAVEKESNAKTLLVQTRDLQTMEKEDCSKLKEGEELKRKTYRCVVHVAEEIDEKKIAILDQYADKEIQLQQETPIRVLHRRTLITRPKMIYSLKYEIIQPHFMYVDLETQAGTYVKEFIHSDFGRTTPNLCTILDCDCDILQLDVLSIVFDWPPALGREYREAPKEVSTPNLCRESPQ